MPDTLLILGGVTFQDFEIPESINFGGSQRIVVHKMIGGGRAVDALGADQDDFTWSGRFRTSTALQRAQQIDRLRILGQPVFLAWGGLSYTVLIARFEADYQRSYEIPYRITCTPVYPEVAPAQGSQGIDGLVGGDTTSAGGLLSAMQSSIGSAFPDVSAPLTSISTSLTSATSAIGLLGTLAGRSSSQTAGIVASLTAAQTGMQGVLSVADGHVLQGAQQIGGVVSGDPSGSVARLQSQIGALGTLSSMVVARGTLGRAAANVSQAGSSS